MDRHDLASVTIATDGTAHCDRCAMPLIPYSHVGHEVRLECANRHHAIAELPDDAAVVRLIDNWIMKRGAQLHEQHERWGTDDADGPHRGENV